jgi:hypothetical protein
MSFPKYRSRIVQILNVPHTRKELSWQLGEEGRNYHASGPSLACGLAYECHLGAF